MTTAKSTNENSEKAKKSIASINSLSDPKSSTEITKNVEDGSLVVVTVGTQERPASKEDISAVCERINTLFENAKGIKVLVVPHLVTVQTFSLPQLRQIIGEVLTSNNPDTPNNPIIDLDLDLS
jgi:UDP-glucose 6-dehydrogenase